MVMRAGRRDRKVTFYPRTTTTDSEGTEIEADGTGIVAMAAVTFGSGQERREASQAAAQQTATFRVLSTAALRAATGRWQIEYLGDRWGITGPPAEVTRHELEFTAVRNGA